MYMLCLESGEGEDTNLSYTFRLSTAKILLDLEDYDNANKVHFYAKLSRNISFHFLSLEI